MGMEAVCAVSCPAGQGKAKALLETAEVLVRGDFRWKVPFTELRSVEVNGGELRLTTASGVTALSLGEATAAKWADKIRNPPSLMKKLGVKVGCRYAISGIKAVGFAEQVEAAGAIQAALNPEMFFVFAESDADLANVWERANTVWVIYTKGHKDFTEARVRDHGRAVGMMDTKVASFSSTHTALRFSRVLRSV